MRRTLIRTRDRKLVTGIQAEFTALILSKWRPKQSPIARYLPVDAAGLKGVRRPRSLRWSFVNRNKDANCGCNEDAVKGVSGANELKVSSCGNRVPTDYDWRDQTVGDRRNEG